MSDLGLSAANRRVLAWILGGYALLYSALALSDVCYWFCDSGPLHRVYLEAALEASRDGLSLHMLGGSLWFQLFLLGIQAASGVLLVRQQRPRAMCIALFFLLLSAAHRAPFLMAPATHLAALLALWSSFLGWNSDHSASLNLWSGRALRLQVAASSAYTVGAVCGLSGPLANLMYGLIAAEWVCSGVVSRPWLSRVVSACLAGLLLYFGQWSNLSQLSWMLLVLALRGLGPMDKEPESLRSNLGLVEDLSLAVLGLTLGLSAWSGWAAFQGALLPQVPRELVSCFGLRQDWRVFDRAGLVAIEVQEGALAPRRVQQSRWQQYLRSEYLASLGLIEHRQLQVWYVLVLKKDQFDPNNPLELRSVRFFWESGDDATRPLFHWESPTSKTP